MTEHRAQVEELLAGYRRSRDQLAAVHRELSSVTASASDADGLITATVGPRGTLTNLVIADSAYRRYRPAELAEQIVRVTGAATVRALARAGEVLAPALPSETDPQALLLGTADLEAREIAPPQRKPQVDEDSYEDQNWIRERAR
ncbi:MAG TPA: YbaB/EbfC family nucleoid-associated protein [Amycolatopsis sp.]|uniref:YbaB/EbfC family nucleoid-associated protein n=1 Tax=Amycolatopsis sp. TaxID=37632 RepID=UPI002B4A92C0|nr:YbaB/EbfC family nucleoid-associated protein [Amycolatopsis sp.]HJQ45760.1 YbaB/EbfC family nucleoid-associated protein [Amycolatopsis sp.]HKS46082.1 YbaB/EbfC family nucleoid-associated protein [Amycolatopsis sp.]